MGGGGTEKSSLENMSLKHIQSTTVTRTEPSRKKARVIGSLNEIAEIKVKNSCYCTLNILITVN